MENKNKKRILIGVLIVLIIMNLASLGTFSYHKYKNKPRFQKELEKREPNKQKQHERVKYFVKKELQLSDEQFKDYCQLKDLNLKNSGEMWDKLTNLREATILEITKENTDTARLIQLSDSIGFYHKKMQLEMNRHFLSVKKTLKPEQITKFNEMILNMENGDWRRHGRNPENKDSNYHQNRQKSEKN
jgi:hypothetical protein